MAAGAGRPVRASRISFDLKDPPTHRRAIREIGEAIRAAGGNMIHAAEALQVSHRQLMRWAQEYPGLKKHIDSVRRRVGYVDRSPKWSRERD